MFNTVVLSREELTDIIYNSGGQPKQPDLEKTIKYFYFRDLIKPLHISTDNHEQRIFFVVLFEDKEIIGLCKLEESPYNQQGLFWIDYISIKESYQGRGYVKNIIDTMMKFCKNNNFILETSGYSKKGWESARGLLHDYAKKYDVELIDKRDKPQYESLIRFSDFKINEEYDYIKETILKFIKNKNLYLIDDKYLELFHGTDPATYKKIEKSGILKSGTWFGIDYETSRRYGLMRIHRGEPIVMRIYVNIDSLYISGEYFIAKHDLKMNLTYGSGSNIYENKNNKKYYICENNNTTEMIIPEDILEFHDLFTRAGYDLFLVGGCVRDFIMGKTPHDFDLTTNATPDIVQKILKDYRTDLQGAHFGVIRVYTEDEPKGYEVASYRRDISSGRNTKGDDQKVEIGSHITIKDDVMRRDITSNALFYDIGKKQIIDLVGGIEDIKKEIIRAVGNPVERFNEDRLRILRCFRFSARSHFKIDEDTADAIKKDNRLSGISPEENVSQERILEEIWKMWEYSHKNNDLPAWKMYLRYLTGFKMWNQMFKNTLVNEDVININSLDLIQMYAYLFLENIPNSDFNKRLVREFKFSSDYTDIICFLLTFYNNINDVDKVFDMKKKQTQFDINPDIIKEFSDIHKLDKKFVDKFIEYDLTVSGQELMDSGLKGSEIGIEQRKQEKEIFQNMMNESFDF